MEGAKLAHVAIAERALGRSLPEGAEVHHVNGIKNDNRPENLVICPGREYHMLLHVRTRAHEACGDGNKRRCVYCKKYDDVSAMKLRKSKRSGNEYRHRACHAAYTALRKRLAPK
jgi:hypothetical protein